MKTLSTKAIVLILILFAVYSCEKEENHETMISELEPKKQEFSNVSSKDIPEVMNFLRQDGKSKLDFPVYRNGSDINKSGNDDLVLTTVELDNIKKLTNPEGLSNYSFHLTFKNHQNLEGYNSIFNLVVKELSTGDYYSYIQEFRVENIWLLSNNLKTDMQSYTGYLVFYTTEGEFLINIELSSGTIVDYEETGKCDAGDGTGAGSGGGSGNGFGDGGNGSISDGGSSPGTGSPGGGFGGITGASLLWLCNRWGEYHTSPSNCSHEQFGGTWVVSIKSLIPDGKSQDLIKNGCLPAPEECFNDVQDPCECDGNGGCVEENDEVPINVFPINIMLVFQLNSLLDQNLLPSQVQAMGPYGDEFFQQMIDFLNENPTIEAQNFIHAVAETIEEVGSEGEVEVDFDVNNYPGINDGHPFQWWQDNEYVVNNFTVFEPVPNAYELLLFTIFPAAAVAHSENSIDALNRANQLCANGTLCGEDTSGIEDGKADAFRHSYWNALGTAEFGDVIMKLFADAHEWGMEGLPVEMDLFNNEVGRNIGLNFSFSDSNELIEFFVLEALNNGELKYINDGNLIPTNQ